MPNKIPLRDEARVRKDLTSQISVCCRFHAGDLASPARQESSLCFGSRSRFGARSHRLNDMTLRFADLRPGICRWLTRGVDRSRHLLHRHRHISGFGCVGGSNLITDITGLDRRQMGGRTPPRRKASQKEVKGSSNRSKKPLRGRWRRQGCLGNNQSAEHRKKCASGRTDRSVRGRNASYPE